MAIKPKRQPRWLRPAGVERDYVAYVRTIARDTRDAARRHVLPILADLRQDDIPTVQAFRVDGVEDMPPTTGVAEALRVGFLAAIAEAVRVPIAQRIAEFSRAVSRFNQKQFRKVVRQAYGVDLFANEPWLIDVLTQWEAENISLIRSIPRDSLNSLHGKILQAVRTGRPVKELTQFISENYDVSVNRAELIAVDQVGKLNGQLTMERQKRLGVKKYKWRGSLDERERPHHVAREGMVFSWDDPPYDGHPGQAIRCRCTAEAVLPLLDDIEGLQYPDLTPARGFALTNNRGR